MHACLSNGYNDQLAVIDGHGKVHVQALAMLHFGTKGQDLHQRNGVSTSLNMLNTCMCTHDAFAVFDVCIKTRGNG